MPEITTPQAVTNEFFVNTIATSDQYNPTVTALTGGGFVIIWHNHENANIDGSGRGVSGQLYDASGNKVGSQFLVNTQVAGKQDTASVEPLNSGGFIVVWQSESATSDSSGLGVAGQIFDATANKVGSEFTINTETDGNQTPRGLATFTNGNFLVVWESADPDVDGDAVGISGQRFDGSGNKIGTEFTANSEVEGNQYHPSVATFSSGGFIVSWTSYDPQSDGNGSGVSAQIFDAAGNKLGVEFTVNTQIEGDQLVPKITTLTGGGFVITWYGDDPDVDGSGSGVSGQLFDSSGNKVGTEFTVNTHSTGAQNVARITSLDDGGFLLAWRSDDPAVDGSGQGISGQRFDSSATKVGSEFNLSGEVQGTQTITDVADLGGGKFIATWQSSDPDVDVDGTGISARIFSANTSPTNSNNTVITTEDTAYTFKTADFNFSDTNSRDSLQSVRIDATTTGLTLSGTAVTSAQVITVADITAGNLKYTPLADQNGNGIAGFGFSVSDGNLFSTAASTMTINATAVNDAPISPNTFSHINNIQDDGSTTLGGPNGIASVTISGTTYLYVSSFSDNGIGIFSVASNGALSSVGGVTDDATLHLGGAVDIKSATIGGNPFVFAIAGSGADNGISSFSVGAGGALTAADNFADNGTVFLSTGRGLALAEVSGVTYLFTSGGGDHGISAFSVSSAGLFTNVSNVADTGSTNLNGAQRLETVTVGSNTYLITTSLNEDGISVFSVAAGGTLTNVDNVNDAGALELDGALGIASATVNGTSFIFVSGIDDDGISVFSVASDGKLTNVDNVVDTAGLLLDGVRGLDTVAINGVTYLFAAGTLDNGVSVFAVGNSGKLTHLYNIVDDANTLLDGARVPMVADISGTDHLFIASQDDNSLSSFSQSATTLTTAEDTAHTFTTADFSFADADGNTLQTVRIDATVSGLALNNASVTNGQEIAVADITGGNLIYTPPANQSGATLATLQYSVGDGTTFASSPTSRVIAVTSVEDLPTGANHTESIAANTTYTLKLPDFGFVDADGDSFSSLRVDSLSLATGDTLTNDGTPIAINSTISLKDIDDGDIKYTPATDGFGTARSTFTFSVNDGKGYAAAPATFTFNVAQGNQAPTTTNSTVSATEDTTYVFKPSDFNFSDADTGDTLKVVSISNLSVPAGDQLLYQGNTAGENDAVTATELTNGDLKYIPQADANGNARVTFDFTVTDNHNKSSVAASTLTINVADVAEPSTGGGNSSGGGSSSSGSDSGSGSSSSGSGSTTPVKTGSSSTDTLEGSSGNDTIDGGSGADVLRGGAGDDSVVGGSGNDEVFAGADDKGNDTVQGNRGNDVLGGGDGNDLIVGGDASDDLDLKNLINAGDDTLFGGAGDDFIVGGSFDTKTQTVANSGQGENSIWAGTGNDTVYGDDKDDVLGGGEGNDSINAGAGNDVLYGGRGGPDIPNDDTLNGGDGGDKVFASSGADNVDGGAGDDTLFGGIGDDTVNGGADNDMIWGGAGDDVLTGGEGSDTFAFLSGFGTDTITDFGSGDNSDMLDLSGIDSLTLAGLRAAAIFSGGNAQLNIGEHGTLTLEGVTEAELHNIIDAGQIVVA